MARKLKLIPPSAENANGIDFEMHFNPHSQRPDQRAHMDFKGTIKVLFQREAKGFVIKKDLQN